MTIKIPLRKTSKFAVINKQDFELVKKFKWYLFTSDNLEYAIATARLINGKYIPLGSLSEIAKIRRKKVPKLFEKGTFYPANSLKRISMHSLIMKTPKGMVTDHKNGNGLDNRRSNLRICTHTDNMRNRRLSKKNTSGYYGVSYSSTEKRKKRWMVLIRDGKKHIYIGRYYTKEEAALAYNAVIKKYHGEFARLNDVS